MADKIPGGKAREELGVDDIILHGDPEVPGEGKRRCPRKPAGSQLPN